MPMSASGDFLQGLKLQHPIIQAPLAGGGDTPDLVSAVSNAGGLGFIGAAYLSPEQIAHTAHDVKSKTTRPFGINLFAPLAPVSPSISPDVAMRRVAPYFSELGLPAPSLPASPSFTFTDQLAAALETGAAVFSFTFGLLPPEAMQSLKQRKIFIMGTATTVNEAIELEKTGVDAIVAQGSEAGGHRGTFRGDFSAAMIGTISLVPQVVDAVRVPVIASGGIMDGRGIAAVLALGASAVQLGTSFLTCTESGVPDAYREAILRPRRGYSPVPAPERPYSSPSHRRRKKRPRRFSISLGRARYPPGASSVCRGISSEAGEGNGLGDSRPEGSSLTRIRFLQIKHGH